jgi:hypothetical protein
MFDRDSHITHRPEWTMLNTDFGCQDLIWAVVPQTLLQIDALFLG